MMEFYTYADLNLMDYFNLQPSEIKGRNNVAVETARRYLFTKIYSVFEFTIPDDWDLNYFRFWLFRAGSIAVIYTKEYGWICQPYSIVQLNLYYNPKEILVYNQFLENPKTGLIGINSEIVKIMDDYFGLTDIVDKYAVVLAQIDRAINVNLMQCNNTQLFEADSKKQAEAIYEAYGEASSGKPLVIINKDVMDGRQITTLLSDANKNYLVDKLLEARRGVINAFLTEIGIRNANYDKKERLNSQEVNENNDETRAIISVIYDNIVECFERVNRISDLGLSVKMRYDYDNEEVGSDGKNNPEWLRGVYANAV